MDVHPSKNVSIGIDPYPNGMKWNEMEWHGWGLKNSTAARLSEAEYPPIRAPHSQTWATASALMNGGPLKWEVTVTAVHRHDEMMMMMMSISRKHIFICLLLRKRIALRKRRLSTAGPDRFHVLQASISQDPMVLRKNMVCHGSHTFTIDIPPLC